MSDPEGYTLSYRKKWENPIFRNLLEAAIWSWMCDTAAWKETKVRFAGGLVELQRGQLVTSRRFISEGFGIGEQVTRTFLENLEKGEMLNQQATHKGTIITICNYDKYQINPQTTNPQTNQQLTSTQPAANPNKNKDNNTTHANAHTYAREGDDKNSITDFQKIFDAGCEIYPMLAIASTALIHQWLAEGCNPELDVIPEIKRHAKSPKTIKSWSYFTGAIMDAKATRTTPLPKGIPHATVSKPSSAGSGLSKTDRLYAAVQQAAEIGGFGIEPRSPGQEETSIHANPELPSAESLWP